MLSKQNWALWKMMIQRACKSTSAIQVLSAQIPKTWTPKKPGMVCSFNTSESTLEMLRMCSAQYAIVDFIYMKQISTRPALPLRNISMSAKLYKQIILHHGRPILKQLWNITTLQVTYANQNFSQRFCFSLACNADILLACWSFRFFNSRSAEWSLCTTCTKVFPCGNSPNSSCNMSKAEMKTIQSPASFRDH